MPASVLCFVAVWFLAQGGAEPDSAGLRSVDESLKGSELDLAKEVVRMLTVLGVMLVGLVLAVKLMPRWLRARATGPGLIEVVERHPLEGRRSLVLVKVGDAYLLVGSSEAGLTLLSGPPLDSVQLDALRDELGGPVRPDSSETPFQEALARQPASEPTP